jgi:hypothetical protein
LNAFDESDLLERNVSPTNAGSRARLSPARSSAERAVDDDFSQSGLENDEFLVVEPFDEPFRHTLEMDRHCFGQTRDTGVDQGDKHASPVPGGIRTTHQALFNQPRDAAGQPRPREEGAGGELRHPQLAARAGELCQYVEGCQAHPVSNGRAEVILGRESSTESFPLFGYDPRNYEELFEEKVNLFAELLKERPGSTSERQNRPR